MGCFFIYTPLCFVRKIEKFSSTHILADIIIFVTAIACIVYTGVYASEHGEAAGTVFLNSSKFLNVIGFAIYSYEGIGVILPVMELTAQP